MAKNRNRASDAQRTAVLHALDEAFAAGRLDHFEHFERTRTATGAKYIDELRPLVADLRGGDDDLGLGQDESRQQGQDPSEWPRPPRWRRRGLVAGSAVAVVAIAVVGGAVAAAVWNSPSSSTSSGSTSEEVGPGPLHTEDGITRLLDETVAEFPAQGVDSILIYGRYATLSRPHPADPHKRVTYEFRGGWEERRIDPIEADSDLDIGAIDAADVTAAISAAPEVLELDPDMTVTSHVQVSADALGDPEVRVSASEGRDGDLGTATFGPGARVRAVEMP